MIHLNVGCGEFTAPGWVNMDLHNKPPRRPDMLGSILAIPLDDNTCSHVYAGHIFEHIEEEFIWMALSEVKRVLYPGGQLMIVGPDMDRTQKRMKTIRSAIVGGGHRWPGDAHQWVATEAKMLSHLDGWDTTPIPIREVPPPWPVVSRIFWQFAILCLPRPEESA